MLDSQQRRDIIQYRIEKSYKSLEVSRMASCSLVFMNFVSLVIMMICMMPQRKKCYHILRK